MNIEKNKKSQTKISFNFYYLAAKYLSKEIFVFHIFDFLLFFGCFSKFSSSINLFISYFYCFYFYYLVAKYLSKIQ
jgi:hypothetical protein